jgi:hypothetical protein
LKATNGYEPPYAQTKREDLPPLGDLTLPQKHTRNHKIT